MGLYGGGSAPEADPQIGEAARLSAQTGADMLSWMKNQAKTTNRWAADDRARMEDVFQPMQDAFITEAQGWDSPERKAEAAREAGADVALQARQTREQGVRQAMALGVNPASGRFANATAKAGVDTALAGVGAQNLARRNVEAEALSMRANAINMGSGLAVNPGTSMSLSNGAVSAGGNAAMNGYGQQGSLLNTKYNQEMQSYQQKQSGLSSVMGAMGTVLGAIPFTSSEKVKHDKQPFDSLAAIEKMPVEKWTYNEGAGDGGTHVGPYAEDFARETGVGDGSSIDPITMMGLTMGAVKQLAAKVDAMGAPPRSAAPRKAKAPAKQMALAA